MRFKRRRGAVTADLDAGVAALLAALAGDLLGLLGDGVVTDEDPLAAVPLGNFLKLVGMALHRRQVVLPQVVGLSQELVGRFEADELHHAVELQRDLVVVHHLKQDYFVSAVPQPL